MLEKSLPHAMLKAKPNLESMIRTLKRDWAIIYDMLSGKDNSSFGWDEHRQMVVAKDAVWNLYISLILINFDYFREIHTKGKNWLDRQCSKNKTEKQFEASKQIDFQPKMVKNVC
ncbi:hypothetical protein GOBAR_DD27081 [Gossypium barbadense]|nr:hypothetical protein GOBAR_DD27081 [Gossypium barbadense]